MKLANCGRLARKFDRKAVLAAATLAALAAVASPARAGNKNWVAGTGTWSVGANWSPNGMPSSGDTVQIGDTALIRDQQVFLDANPVIANLTLTNGMILDTKAHPVNVTGTTTLTSFLNNPSRMYLRHAPGPYDLATVNLNILEGSDIFLVNQPTIFVTGSMNLDFDSDIVGGGVFNFTGDSGVVLKFNGGWFNNSDLALTFNQSGDGLIDLDGDTIMDQLAITDRNGSGTSTQYQQLTVSGTSLSDAFDDDFVVGPGNSINMNLSEGWELGGTGRIVFPVISWGAVAKVNGNGTMTVNGRIEFDDYVTSIDSMAAEINAPVVFNGAADVVLGSYDTLDINGAATVNGGSFSLGGNGSNTLKFNGATKVAGGTFTTDSSNSEVQFNGATHWSGTATINGTAWQNGNATVNSTATINAETLDMDGELGGTIWTINAPLTINADEIDTGNNLFGGTININSAFLAPASLTLNLPAGDSWTSQGVLNVTGSTVGAATTLAGSDVKLSGPTNITYGNSFSARIDLLSSATMTINSNSYLYLNGGTVADPNTITAGRIVGAGKLRATDGHALHGYGTIATAIDFDGNAEILAKDGTLNISGVIEDVGVIGTANDNSTLDLLTTFNADAATKIELKGGTLTGAGVINGGETRGRGTITNVSFINNGSINVTGTQLVINPLLTTDLDGTSETGVLVVTGGNLIINDAPTDAFNGVATIGVNRTLQVSGGWTVGNGGALNLQGTQAQPSIVNGPGQTISGAVNVPTSARGKFDIPTTFGPTASVTLVDAQSLLELAQDGTITQGATIAGAGTLRNAANAKLTMLDQSNVGVRVENAGTVEIGSPFSGTVGVKRFVQQSSGRLNQTLMGVTPGTLFDRMNVTETASLNGTLAISAGLYNPEYYVGHEIIHASGGRSGVFSTILGVALAPTKYLAVTYDADSVFVTAALPGDANLNGAVTLEDFNQLASNFGVSAGAIWTGGDFTGDGAVTLLDFNALAGNFGISAGAEGPSIQDWTTLQSAVPEPTGLLPLIGLGALLRRRRCSRRLPCS